MGFLSGDVLVVPLLFAALLSVTEARVIPTGSSINKAALQGSSGHAMVLQGGRGPVSGVRSVSEALAKALSAGQRIPEVKSNLIPPAANRPISQPPPPNTAFSPPKSPFPSKNIAHPSTSIPLPTYPLTSFQQTHGLAVPNPMLSLMHNNVPLLANFGDIANFYEQALDGYTSFLSSQSQMSGLQLQGTVPQPIADPNSSPNLGLYDLGIGPSAYTNPAEHPAAALLTASLTGNANPLPSGASTPPVIPSDRLPPSKETSAAAATATTSTPATGINALPKGTAVVPIDPPDHLTAAASPTGVNLPPGGSAASLIDPPDHLAASPKSPPAADAAAANTGVNLPPGGSAAVLIDPPDHLAASPKSQPPPGGSAAVLIDPPDHLAVSSKSQPPPGGSAAVLIDPPDHLAASPKSQPAAGAVAASTSVNLSPGGSAAVLVDPPDHLAVSPKSQPAAGAAASTGVNLPPGGSAAVLIDPPDHLAASPKTPPAAGAVAASTSVNLPPGDSAAAFIDPPDHLSSVAAGTRVNPLQSGTAVAPADHSNNLAASSAMPPATGTAGTGSGINPTLRGNIATPIDPPDHLVAAPAVSPPRTTSGINPPPGGNIAVAPTDPPDHLSPSSKGNLAPGVGVNLFSNGAPSVLTDPPDHLVGTHSAIKSGSGTKPLLAVQTASTTPFGYDPPDHLAAASSSKAAGGGVPPGGSVPASSILVAAADPPDHLASPASTGKSFTAMSGRTTRFPLGYDPPDHFIPQASGAGAPARSNIPSMPTYFVETTHNQTVGGGPAQFPVGYDPPDHLAKSPTQQVANNQLHRGTGPSVSKNHLHLARKRILSGGIENRNLAASALIQAAARILGKPLRLSPLPSPPSTGSKTVQRHYGPSGTILIDDR